MTQQEPRPGQRWQRDDGVIAIDRVYRDGNGLGEISIVKAIGQWDKFPRWWVGDDWKIHLRGAVLIDPGK